MRFPKVPRTGFGLRDVFTQAFDAQAYKAFDGDDMSAFEALFRRSPGIDVARQALPRWAGGYGPDHMRGFDSTRAQSPDRRLETMRLGDYPTLDPVTSWRSGRGADTLRRAAQVAGAFSQDTVTQGALNFWWFINAAEAAAMAAGQQGMYGALGGKQRVSAHARPGNPFKQGSYRTAAAYPLILTASAATGGLFRNPGYAAVLPSEEDRKVSEDPITERILRAIGRSGKLLPFDEFQQERPDVSQREYGAYKAYLHGNKMPIKGTMEGIHGPEISILGKSVPLITGILPIAGGVLGGRMGVRMAGKRLAGTRQGKRTGTDQFEQLHRLGNTAWQARTDLRQASATYAQSPSAATDARRQAAHTAFEAVESARKRQEQLVNHGLLKGAVIGSSAGIGISAAGAMLLEETRRALNAKDNQGRAERRAQYIAEEERLASGGPQPQG